MYATPLRRTLHRLHRCDAHDMDVVVFEYTWHCGGVTVVYRNVALCRYKC